MNRKDAMKRCGWLTPSGEQPKPSRAKVLKPHRKSKKGR